MKWSLETAEDVIDYWDLDWLELPQNAYVVIFNHDFAKALWGEAANEFVEFDGDGMSHFIPAWQYHLQQMVIADDPIKYLGGNL